MIRVFSFSPVVLISAFLFGFSDLRSVCVAHRRRRPSRASTPTRRPLALHGSPSQSLSAWALHRLDGFMRRGGPKRPPSACLTVRRCAPAVVAMLRSGRLHHHPLSTVATSPTAPQRSLRRYHRVPAASRRRRVCCSASTPPHLTLSSTTSTLRAIGLITRPPVIRSIHAARRPVQSSACAFVGSHEDRPPGYSPPPRGSPRGCPTCAPPLHRPSGHCAAACGPRRLPEVFPAVTPDTRAAVASPLRAIAPWHAVHSAVPAR